MKRVLTLLTIIVLALIMMGIDSCQRDWQGHVIKIQQDGRFYSVFSNTHFSYHSEFWIGITGGISQLLATRDNKLFMISRATNYASPALSIFDANGNNCACNNIQDLDPSDMIASPDGKYVYIKNGRIDLDTMTYSELIPELGSNVQLLGISADSRYAFYYKSNYPEPASYRIYDLTTMQYLDVSVEPDISIGSPVYIAEKNYIYFVNWKGLYRMRPDGSELHLLNSLGATKLTALYGGELMLQSGQQTSYLLDVDSHEIIKSFSTDKPFNSLPPLVCSSKTSTKIYYVNSNGIRCYDWVSGFDHPVIKGGRKNIDINTVITCSWDGNWIYFGGMN